MVERLAAKKVRIHDIVGSKYFAGNKDEMKADYVVTQFGEKMSKVNFIGTVVDKFESEDGTYAAVTVDDGSGLVRAKVFKNTDMVKDVQSGDAVLVIGKIKEYQGEVYVNLEIVKKVEPNYETKHKAEVLRNLIEQKKVADEIRKMTGSLSEEELKNYAQTYGLDGESLNAITSSNQIDYKPMILEILQQLDKGEGVEVNKIFEAVKLPENVVENALTELLDDGFLYEPQAGRLKKI
jgi:RPA family protein